MLVHQRVINWSIGGFLKWGYQNNPSHLGHFRVESYMVLGITHFKKPQRVVLKHLLFKSDSVYIGMAKSVLIWNGAILRFKIFFSSKHHINSQSFSTKNPIDCRFFANLLNSDFSQNSTSPGDSSSAGGGPSFSFLVQRIPGSAGDRLRLYCSPGKPWRECHWPQNPPKTENMKSLHLNISIHISIIYMYIA